MTRITNIIYKESVLLNQLLTDVTFYEKLYESKRINEGLEVLKLFNEAVDVEMGDDPDKKKEWFQHDFHTQNVFGFSVKKKTKEFLNRFEVSYKLCQVLINKKDIKMKYDLPKIDRAHARTLLNFSFNKEIVTLTLKQIFKTLDESFNSENNSVGVSDKDLKSELRFISNILEILSQ